MAKRQEHCHFKILNSQGKCIAKCSKNDYHQDCIGNKHETIKEFQARVVAERRLM